MNTFNLPPGARCVLCGVVLSGQVAADQHRRVFCARHRTEGRHCRYCDSFFLPSGGKAQACSSCAASQVFDGSGAEAACTAASGWFVRNGLRLPGSVPLCLSSVMPGSPFNGGTRMLGYAEKSTGFFGVARTTIVLEAGLPLMLLRLVLAHELGHASLACEKLRLPTWAEEGSCDWLAHRYLGEFPTPEAAMHRRRIEARSDPIYGAGFQWVAARLAGKAPRDVVGLLRATRLPLAAPRP
jgi:hypothetical protein